MSKTFCHFPWSNLTLGSKDILRPCCQFDMKNYFAYYQNIDEYLKSDFLNDIRKKMINGEKVDGCHRCYDEEEDGKLSLRKKTPFFNEFKQEFINNTTINGEYSGNPYRLDLKLSNLCNLKCRMCTPTLSSQIQKEFTEMEGRSELLEDQKMDLDTSNIIFDDSNFFSQVRKISKDLKRIYASGGEPLINKNFYSFLEYCIDAGYSKNINLSLSSNFVSLPDNFFILSSKFRYVSITISLDGTEKTYEYIRHPAKWKTIVKNIDKLKEFYKSGNDNLVWNFCIVPQIYNVFDIKNTLSWMKQQKTHLEQDDAFIDQSWLHTPKYLRIENLPNHLKQELLQEYQGIQIDSFNKQLINGLIHELNNERDEIQFQNFIKVTKWRDKAKQQKFENYLPILYKKLQLEWN